MSDEATTIATCTRYERNLDEAVRYLKGVRQSIEVADVQRADCATFDATQIVLHHVNEDILRLEKEIMEARRTRLIAEDDEDAL